MSEEKQGIVSIENITGNQLVNVSEWEKKIQEVKKANPIIEIIDNATYEAEKKARTSVKSVRVELDKQDGVIASVFTKARKETISIYKGLLDEISPFEQLHQAEVDKWEKQKENERLERERIEQSRIDSIKAKIDEFETEGYQCIKNVDFAGIEEGYKNLEKIADNDFDFEEYDILWQQARQRIIDAYAVKVSDLKEKEAQRIENEILEKEAYELRKTQELQNVRLGLLQPFLAYVTTDVTKLNELSHEEWEKLFKQGKSGYDAAESDRLAKEQKESEEKKALFNIRKSRLEKLGVFYDAERDYFRHETIDGIGRCSEDIENTGTIVFESLIIDLEDEIGNYNKEQKLKKRFDERVKTLKDLGIVTYENVYMHPIGDSINKEAVLNGSDDLFEDFIKSCTENISRLKKEEEENNKANKARQKQLAGDKKAVLSYIESLEFRDAVPNVKHADCEGFLLEIEQKVSEFKSQLSNALNNL